MFSGREMIKLVWVYSLAYFRETGKMKMLFSRGEDDNK